MSNNCRTLPLPLNLVLINDGDNLRALEMEASGMHLSDYDTRASMWYCLEISEKCKTAHHK